MTVICGRTFAAALKKIGVAVPENCQKITITCKSSSDPARIVFHCISIFDNTVVKSKVDIVSPLGDALTGEALFRLIKGAAQLPDETTEFTITADTENVAMISLSAAFPIEAVDALAGLKFV